MKEQIKNILKNKKVWIILLAAAVVICALAYYFWPDGDSDELFFYENSFEAGQEVLDTDYWKEGATDFITECSDAKDGSNSVYIENNEENDSRFAYTLKVKKGYFYKVSCWIKTENVGTEDIGGNISVKQRYFYFGDIRGSSDWTYVEGYIRALKSETISLWLRLGGYSSENTGRVYFDGFKIEEMKKLPAGININSVNTTGNTVSQEGAAEEWQYVVGYTCLFVFLSAILILIYKSVCVNKEKIYFKGEVALFILLVGGFTLRCVAAPFAQGFEGDVYLFKRWGDIMASDFFNFYDVANDTAGIADYPPFYMYVIGIIGKIMQVFNVSLDTYAYKLAIKLPPIAADMISAFFVYKIVLLMSKRKSSKWINEDMAAMFAGLYLFNPMVLFDSVVWGQMDSFLAMFMVFAVYAAMKNKVTLSAVLFGISIMIKPQGLFAGPVLLYYVLVNGNIKDKIKNFIKCAVAVPLTMVVISLPYMIKDGIMFLPDLFSETAGRYAYASVNGFNFFALAGLNWVDDSKIFMGLSYYTWGMIFLGIIVIAGFVIYMLLPRDYEGREFLTALFLVMGVFNFTIRMHERYMFPAVLISLIVAVIDENKFMLKIHGLITATTFFNALIVLGKYNSGSPIYEIDKYMSARIVSAVNVAAFILVVVYCALKIRGKKKEEILEEDKPNESEA